MKLRSKWKVTYTDIHGNIIREETDETELRQQAIEKLMPFSHLKPILRDFVRSNYGHFLDEKEIKRAIKSILIEKDEIDWIKWDDSPEN